MSAPTSRPARVTLGIAVGLGMVLLATLAAVAGVALALWVLALVATP